MGNLEEVDKEFKNASISNKKINNYPNIIDNNNNINNNSNNSSNNSTNNNIRKRRRFQKETYNSASSTRKNFSDLKTGTDKSIINSTKHNNKNSGKDVELSFELRLGSDFNVDKNVRYKTSGIKEKENNGDNKQYFRSCGGYNEFNKVIYDRSDCGSSCKKERELDRDGGVVNKNTDDTTNNCITPNLESNSSSIRSRIKTRKERSRQLLQELENLRKENKCKIHEKKEKNSNEITEAPRERRRNRRQIRENLREDNERRRGDYDCESKGNDEVNRESHRSKATKRNYKSQNKTLVFTSFKLKPLIFNIRNSSRNLVSDSKFQRKNNTERFITSMSFHKKGKILEIRGLDDSSQEQSVNDSSHTPERKFLNSNTLQNSTRKSLSDSQIKSKFTKIKDNEEALDLSLFKGGLDNMLNYVDYGDENKCRVNKGNDCNFEQGKYYKKSY